MKHFVIGPVDQDLLEQFFEPTFERIEVSTMEDLFVCAGVFKSKGDCRKNGISGPIPVGINLLGTKKNKFWVWKHP